MKIAIMGAMVEEITPLLQTLGNYKEIHYAGNVYYEAEYKGLELVIAYSKIGKVFSTLTATTMIEKFGAQKLLFSGVAGGINPSLKIGDLIAATALCQHDVDITAFGHPSGFIPEGELFTKSDETLLVLAKEVATDMGKDLLEGVIATGDQFVADEVRKSWIADTFAADALEMEGASVAVVCAALEVPFFILRAISDTADMDAGFNFDAFLESAAKESATFVIKMLDKLAV